MIIATAEADMPAACGGDYPDDSLIANDGLIVPPPNCGCDCNDPVNVTCEFPTLEYHENDSGCSTPNSSWVINSSCEPVSGPGSDYWLAEAPDVNGGSCTAVVTEDEVPDASWETALTACSGSFDSTGCEEGSLCVREPESPFDPVLCVWAEGDLECPAGDYTDRSVYFTDYSDTRSCDLCTCDDAEGSCDGRVVLLNDASCKMAAATITANGTCRQGSFLGVSRARWTVDGWFASCDPSPGTFSGGAAPTGAHTICCMAG